MCDGPVHPNPKVWPSCSECNVAYVLRRGFAFGGNGIHGGWYWYRDCKHKKAEAEVHDDRSKKVKARS